MTIGYVIRFIIALPIWLFSTSTNRKSWDEFKWGLIKHKCEYDYDNPIHNSTPILGDYKYYKCKHYGCNFIKPDWDFRNKK